MKVITVIIIDSGKYYNILTNLVHIIETIKTGVLNVVCDTYWESHGTNTFEIVIVLYLLRITQHIYPWNCNCVESAPIFVDRNSWCLFTFCKLGLVFALFSVLSLSPSFLLFFILFFLPSSPPHSPAPFFPSLSPFLSSFPEIFKNLSLSPWVFTLKELLVQSLCLDRGGGTKKQPYSQKPEIEKGENLHIFQNIMVHNSSNAVPLTGDEKHWIVSMDKRDYIRAGVILSPLMAAFYLHDFLPARPFWTVFTFKVDLTLV